MLAVSVATSSSDAVVSWALPDDSAAHIDLDSSAVAITARSKRVSHGLTTYQLGLHGSAFVPGKRYTFRISAWVSEAGFIAGDVADSSTSMTIFINEAPRGGHMTVTPSEGFMLQTDFFMESFGWYDDPEDYPLLYSMQYYTTDQDELKSVLPEGQVSYTTAVLAQGQEPNFLVYCVTSVRDAHGSVATVASSPVVVNKLQSTYDLSVAFASSMADAAELQKLEGIGQIVGAVAESLNSADCTEAPDCAVLNRKGCKRRRATCGACLIGFLGNEGDGNSMCLDVASVTSESDRRLSYLQSRQQLQNNGSSGSVPVVGFGGVACTIDSDCLSGHCSRQGDGDGAVGTCYAYKRCPETDNGECSGSGECVAYDASGRAISRSSCALDDEFCMVKCDCLSQVCRTRMKTLLYMRGNMGSLSNQPISFISLLSPIALRPRLLHV
jgi:hypothetical protein